MKALNVRVWLGLATLVLMRHAQAADVPRYALPPGRVLVYSLHIENNTEKSAVTYEGRWEFTVLNQNADGSAHIAAVKGQAQTSTAGGQTHSYPESVLRGYFDLMPDGQMKMNPSLTPGFNPQIVFPRLPADAGAMQQGWKGLFERSNVTTGFAMKEPDGGQLVFLGEESGPYHAINQRFDKWSYHFDPAKGMVTKIDAENGQQFGGEQKGSGAIVLEKDEMLSEADLKLWVDEQAAFVKAFEQADESMRKAQMGAANAEELVAQAQQALTEASGNATADAVKLDYEDALKRQQRDDSMRKSYGRRTDPLKNQPIPETAFTDVGGQQHNLSESKGKIIVLEFFNRKSGQCAYTIPQVQKAAQELKDKPVAFFGVTDDADDADIKAVVDATAMSFPVLKGEGSMQGFGALIFPTTVVIDAKGNIHSILYGYSKSRGQDVAEIVTELLKHPEQ